MKRKTYNIIQTILIAILGAVVGWGVVNKNLVVPLVSLTAVLMAKAHLKRKVEEVVEDEMVFRLSEKASYTSVQIFSLVAMIIGLVLITSYSNESREYTAGSTLLLATAGIAFIHFLMYHYYRWKGL